MTSTFWDSDLKTLTEEDLRTHRDQCYRRASEVDTEFRRRAALPFIWASETAMVKQVRAAMSLPTPGADGEPPAWKQPTTIVDAYIAGDRVTHESATWVATGDGAIMHTPGEPDPVMGQRWEQHVAGE